MSVPLGDVVLEATDIEKYFGSNHVLHGVSLAVRRHETVMLIGRSGSGKTTFLRCLNFLEEPTRGTVAMGDLRVEADPLHQTGRSRRTEIRQLRQQTGMVFQEFNLFPHMSVLDNCIDAPINVKGVSRDEAIARAEKYLEKVQMSDKRDEFPARLSGGQKQRVAIARALCMEPEVLLFDEPTSALDPELIGEVITVMEQLAHEGSTMIVVSHEMAFAHEAADRVLYLEGGLVVEEGPPEQVLVNPQTEACQQFLKRFLTEGSKAPEAEVNADAPELDASPLGGLGKANLGGRGGGGS